MHAAKTDDARGAAERERTSFNGGQSRASAGLRSGVGASETLRARILTAAVTLVGEVGYARMTVDRVVALAGSSEETFYGCFDDLDDCLLAAFEDALARIAAVVAPAYDGEQEWSAKVRAALATGLAFVQDEPAVSTFVFVGALGAGPKVLASRMRALERLKIAFEHGIDEADLVDRSVFTESSSSSEIGEFSPLSAEGAVNGALGILHTRLLEASPLARRPLSELAGPLTAMIVLPYVGHVAAERELAPARSRSPRELEGQAPTRRGGSELRPKPGARKRKRPRLTAKQRKLAAALKDGPRTVRELVDATGLSDQTARQSLNRLEARERIVKTERDGKIAYELPAKRRAAARPKVAAGSIPSPDSLRAPIAVGAASNGAGTSPSNVTEAPAATSAPNGAGSPTSNGAGASNGHDRSVSVKAVLQGLDTPISRREFKVIAAIGELNAQGSSPSNREIGNATKIYDPTQVARLLKHLAHACFVENTGTGKAHAWRLTGKGTELLRELEGHVAV
jgi:AcrR family transcriptional regulator/predicted transcriptional regulator/DNA-binding transcriptional ArsR family regulator